MHTRILCEIDNILSAEDVRFHGLNRILFTDENMLQCGRVNHDIHICLERARERFAIAHISDDECDIITADQFLLEIEVFRVISRENRDVFWLAVHQLTYNF